MCVIFFIVIGGMVVKTTRKMIVRVLVAGIID
jgi:hypothetical protein